MAKIGTAHVEIKPVVNVEALDELASLIEEAVARGVTRGMATANAVEIHVTNDAADLTSEAVAHALRRRHA